MLLACPNCQGSVAENGTVASCASCGARFEERDGFLDFAPQIPRSSKKEQPSLGQRTMEDPTFIKNAYLTVGRATFVRMMGGAWWSPLTLAAEAAYLDEFVQPADGPVVDLACGPGQYMQKLARRFGEQRVIGFDLSFPMLEVARRSLPGVRLLRGSALSLPFAAGSLGAVVCWNAFQLFPDPQRAISEVGRCLADGGTFTCFTFARATGPYWLVQSGWRRIVGVRVFEDEDLRGWLTGAGLEPFDWRGPKFIRRFSARKQGTAARADAVKMSTARPG